MRTKHIVLLLLPIFVLLSLASASYGGVFKVYFDVYTHQSPGDPVPNQSLEFWVQIEATKGLRGPDAVDWSKPFTVKAPTGDVFNMNLSSSWYEYQDGFSLDVQATQFAGHAIPPGKYTVSFTDGTGAACTATDTLPSPLAFMAIPTITDPLSNATVASLTPMLKWNAVVGAAYYRLEMTPLGDNNTFSISPLYASPYSGKNIIGTSFTIPQGVLKYNTHYVFRIRAYNDDKSVSRRSQSSWVYFNTPPPPLS